MSTNPHSPAGTARDPFFELDASAQAALVRTGQVSALDLFDAAIARIERLNPQLNALASSNFELARQQARAERSGGPFAGVPTLIKDLLPYPGHRAEFGSRLFKANVAQAGSDYSAALAASGLVVLGKSATSEFGLLGTTETLALGATRNPWNTSLSPGGSSGGAVAAVASGMVPIAHASDGGGSIRGPASLCGLFGFKPSRGRTRNAGVPETLPTARLISDHCVSRSVRDSATWLVVTQRRDAAAPLRPLDAQPGRLDQRLRVGVYRKDGFGHAPLAKTNEANEAIEALDGAARLCERLGHEVIETAGPRFDAQAISEAFFALSGAALGSMFEQMKVAMGGAFNDSLVEPYTRELVARARGLAPEVMQRHVAALDAAQVAAEREMSGFDVLLSPTTPFAAFPLGRFGPTADPELLMQFTVQIAGYTFAASLAGWPAMSVPLHWTAQGLPLGCHFAAPVGQEARLFGLAYQLEEAAPWSARLQSLAQTLLRRSA